MLSDSWNTSFEKPRFTSPRRTRKRKCAGAVNESTSETANRAALDVEASQVRMRAMPSLQIPRSREASLPSKEGRNFTGLSESEAGSHGESIVTDEALRVGQGMIITCRCGQKRHVADCPCGFDAFLENEFRKIQKRYPLEANEANERTTRPEPSSVASLQKPK